MPVLPDRFTALHPFTIHILINHRETGCFSTHVGSWSVVSQPKHHVHPSCFLPSDISKTHERRRRGREEERGRADTVGLKFPLLRQMVSASRCSFPPFDIPRPIWGGRGPVSACLHVQPGIRGNGPPGKPDTWACMDHPCLHTAHS